MTKKLSRSQTDKIIAGVAGGLGEYFEIDSTIIRLLLVLITVMGGAGVLLYIILWLIMPASSRQPAIITEEKIKEFAEEIKDKAQDIKEDWQNRHSKKEVAKAERKSGNFFGWLLVILGAVFLINSYSPYWFSAWLFHLWPIAVIFIGLYLIFRKK